MSNESFCWFHPQSRKRPSLIVAVMLAVFCGPAFADDVSESVTTSDGRSRTYFLHTPPIYDGVTPLPLVISLHFGGGTGAGMAAVTGMSYKADEEGFIVGYPDAIPPGWRDYDVLFLDELIDTLSARYAVDTLRRFMTGYSAGALMTHWMACRLSDKIGAFAPVAGTMLTYDWSGCYPDRPPSIMSFNARNDPLVLYGGYDEYIAVEEAMSNWAERLGCESLPDTFYNETGALRQTWSRTDGTCDIVLWTTEDGGHGWPAESSPHKLSANDKMWEFFKAHPLPGVNPAVEEMNPHLFFRLNLPSSTVFSRSTQVSFSLSVGGHARLEIFDAIGRRVRVIFAGILDAGNHTVEIYGDGLESGVYFVKLSAGTSAQTKRIVLIK